MFKKVLIANRGAIACRVIRTLDRMGIASVAVYSEADRHSLHVAAAGEAVAIGPAPAAESYLDAGRILEAARATGAEAIHPGYGLLSENPDFAEACTAAGIVFVGPRPEHMRAFGLKHTARDLAERAGVPLAPGTGLLADIDAARIEAARIGYPVMLKSTAGGGGIGLQRCRSDEELGPLFERVQRLAQGNFRDGGVFLEKYVERGRHIEVQIFGDGGGRVVALGERDCSAQRRNQKVVEETPAPGIPDALRAELCATAVRLGKSVGYANAGTVEFLYDSDSGAFYFLEVNTRLQVEHGVTEAVTGIDLVEWMLRQAAGEALPPDAALPKPSGAAVQVRLYAEDPGRDFRPSTGRLTHLRWPDAARIETWVEAGSDVSPYYDPMLAKIILHGADRAEALARMQDALAATEIAGIESNLGYLRALIASPEMAAGSVTTRTLEGFSFAPRRIEVLAAGPQTTVQDYPGRLGYWDVGVPPSGPMDDLSFRLANRAVGNPADAAGLEITVSGPVLRFDADTVACLAGAAMPAMLDGAPVLFWRPFAVAAGQTLAIGAASDTGARAYLALRGGIDVPPYLGSRATFALGGFGGHAGRALAVGDMLHLGDAKTDEQPRPVPDALVPAIGHAWEIGVLYGPHGAPDFFTDRDIADFFAADWEVHYNSSRTGVRLIGPKPRWARSDGGEAGLHPSNIHDNAYAVGAVDFTGDMPVILGPDGPSLGGFVCPATVAKAERWKIGQLRPGDRLRFRRLAPAEAAALEARQTRVVESLHAVVQTRSAAPAETGPDAAIVAELPADGARPGVVYRRAGDKYLLVEYGPPVLDLELRFRVQALMDWLRRDAPAGIVDLTPGIRSLQLHYDSLRMPLIRLLDLLMRAEEELAGIEDMAVPSRIVHLPLAWDDSATRLATLKYMQSVRADAPWCPSNIEFIRRINGLADEAAVKRIVFDASYLVLGLGDVYLGAPVATPVDPRHRLVTTKYNPARTWTPENAVGIGGAYLCVYGMEGPGGYQFVGRTCQVWNTHKTTAAFEPGKPWLLRFFDQIRFTEVSEAELLAFREDFPRGKATLRIEPAAFRLDGYRRFLAENDGSIAAFKHRQQAAFEAERARWEAAGQVAFATDRDDLPEATMPVEDAIPAGAVPVSSPVTGSIWRVQVREGDSVAAGDVLFLVESMKMEVPVVAPIGGRIVGIAAAKGRAVALGQRLATILPGA